MKLIHVKQDSGLSYSSERYQLGSCLVFADVVKSFLSIDLLSQVIEYIDRADVGHY